MHLSTSLLKRNISISDMLAPKQRIIIACMPKSASSFLQNVIAEISGYSTIPICGEQGRNEQDINLSELANNAFKNIVNHLHVRGSNNNIKLMNFAKIRPTVLVRNIFDVTVSMRDHIAKNSLIWPMTYYDTSFYELDKSDQYDMVIDLSIPWFVSFYVSWYKAMERNEIPAYWLSYEDIMNDKGGAIEALCRYYKIETCSRNIEAAITTIEGDRRLSNFNVGKKGRGSRELSEGQKQRILKLFRYYPEIDFSRIGVE